LSSDTLGEQLQMRKKILWQVVHSFDYGCKDAQSSSSAHCVNILYSICSCWCAVVFWVEFKASKNVHSCEVDFVR
jgi:hypothetical protein